MSIIAVLTGGFFGTFTALIALFGIGVDWSTGAAIYFTTAAIVALPLIGIGTLHRHKNKDNPLMSDWERELHGYQPSPVASAADTSARRRNSRDRNAA